MAAMKREIRDPVHNFVKLDEAECRVLDSRPFQRLRHIHQLATTYLVYPGATHRRFEHSLGVMELAGRVFDVVTEPDNLRHPVQQAVWNQLVGLTDHSLKYWRQTLRLAALCHDIGHLPFSHAAEKELLPENVDHETLTVRLIQSDHLRPLFEELKIFPRDVAKLAVGPKKFLRIEGEELTPWEALLAEIIVGNAFGVDRMDYLLRDSHHAGVGYGRFDHQRLVDTLRLLPEAPGTTRPGIGVEQGGVPSVLALAYARYFMYLQVYFHRVRRAYDIHLKDFLESWLPGGRFSVDLDDHLAMTDNEVTAALLASVRNPGASGHRHAKRLLERQHFKVLYERREDHVSQNPDIATDIYEAARAEFGDEAVRLDHYLPQSSALDFPVLLDGGEVAMAATVAPEFKAPPVASFGYVFIDTGHRGKAARWLGERIGDFAAPKVEEEETE